MQLRCMGWKPLGLSSLVGPIPDLGVWGIAGPNRPHATPIARCVPEARTRTVRGCSLVCDLI